jgi:hypothetical protein
MEFLLGFKKQEKKGKKFKKKKGKKTSSFGI